MMALSFLASLVLAACGAAGPRPNVVIIVMDTVRADHCSALGYDRPTTPNLEALAREGAVYEDAWSPTCWTGPAHATLFTGLRPENHGFLVGVNIFLTDTVDTLAEHLSRSGYETVCLTANPTVVPTLGLTQGFGTFEGFPEEPPDPGLASRRLTARAIEITRRSRTSGAPYFLFVNYFNAHLPYVPPEELAPGFLPADTRPEEIAEAVRFSPGIPDMLGRKYRQFGSRRWAVLSGLYDAEIASVDAEIGKLVAHLREEGTLDNTILVITSDHGEHLGDHGLCGHFSSLYRAVRHVPLLVRYPGAFAAGERVGRVTRLEDLFPTILSLCGDQVPAGIDGHSLLEPAEGLVSRAILGGLINPTVERAFPEFARSGDWLPRRAVYDGRYHFILRQDGLEELYDVAEDPSESVNLASRRPDLVDLLRRELPAAPWSE